MHNLYDVPVIPQDLSQNETITQISCVLEHLNNVVNDIFRRVESRIEENAQHLKTINNRVSTANTKISKLVGTNKSTKVFSCTKYPAVNVRNDAKTIFSRDNDSIPILKKSTPVSKKTVEDVDLQNKMQFYHVKAGGKKQREIYELAPDEGLGNIPKDLRSVSSLLLFNTQQNPYKRYLLLDPLNPTKGLKQRAPLEEPHGMEAAPASISNRKILGRNIPDTYFYSPGLGEVPQIDVPLGLPDLPGIADDINYSLEMDPAIAPSVATTPAYADLPVLEDFQTTELPLELPVVIENTMVLAQTPPPQIGNTVPHLEIENNIITAGPPPPPPPPPTDLTAVAKAPPPPPIPSTMPFALPVPYEQPSSLYSPPDARANLMEAIRKAGGGAKLRAAQCRESISKALKETPKTSTQGGGSLMADLHAKLSMRRKGISGSKQDAEGAVPSEGVMGKISAMIPAPLKSTHSDEEADTDWE